MLYAATGILWHADICACALKLHRCRNVILIGGHTVLLLRASLRESARGRGEGAGEGVIKDCIRGLCVPQCPQSSYTLVFIIQLLLAELGVVLF